MTISVKSKVRLGTLFLFLLLLAAGGVGIYFTAVLKQDAKGVLQENYESIAYCLSLQQQLESPASHTAHYFAAMDSVVSLQEQNVTESGEVEATNTLRALFQKMKAGDTSAVTIQATRQVLHRIASVNMEAIYQKNIRAERTAEQAMTFMITLTGLIFVVAFTFSVNFPSIIANPIRQLSEAIDQVAHKNYRHRIHLDNNDEFGQLAAAFNNMAERLEYFESSNLNKLLFEKSRAESVINSLRDASIGIDANDIILFANYEALQLLGLRSADIVGQPVPALAGRNDLFRHLVTDASSTPFKIVVDSKENYFIKETIEVGQGDTRSKVIGLRNITSFKELDVAKTNFIATISHELKTPLAASDFSLKLLDDERIGHLSEEQKSLVNSLKEDNRRILKIISELLNLSQVETGKIQLHFRDIGAASIVSKATETVAGTAKQKNILIRETIETGLPRVRADADKTAWVLNNLLTNAIRHSNSDSTIEIAVAQENNTVVFSVQDSGPGIAQEYLPRLFERYFQVPGSNTKGTGLGLAISREFIESQGGSIGVASEPGKGSRFWFTLPVAAS
jgi:NtrC-family two-component system sensor histidine kinase KinB